MRFADLPRQLANALTYACPNQQVFILLTSVSQWNQWTSGQVHPFVLHLQ